MPQKIGFRSVNGETFQYIESTTGDSIAFGFDVSTGTFNINTSTSPNATPAEATSNFAIDPDVNGDIVLQPNGNGILNLLSGTGGIVATGVASVSVANKNYVTINTVTGKLGSDSGPTAITTLNGNTGSATGSTVTVTTGSSNMGATAQFTGSGSTLSLSIVDGNSNIFLNPRSGTQTLSGQSNSVFGKDAGNSLSSGSFNTIVGGASGFSISSGSSNCSLGCIALGAATYNGSNCIGIGFNAGSAYTSTESSNIVISAAGTGGESNTIRLGTTGSGAGQQNRCFVAGIFGVTVGVSGVAVVVDNVGQLGTVVSSERYKENIKPLDDTISEQLYNLKVKEFAYKANNAHGIGLIAEEVEKTFPELLVRNKEGLPETVKYLDLIPILVKELQKAVQRIEILESKL